MNKSISISTCDKILNAGTSRQYSEDDVYQIREWLGAMIDLELEAFEIRMNNKKENITD
jgi:hypothetical protein